MSHSQICIVASLVLLAACSGSSPDTAQNRRDTMTQRQRDSVLAQSGLPGARGVGKAMKAADSARARQARMDSASRP